MQSKSDALIVVPTMLNSIKAFHIFKTFWIIADSLYLYQMSKNATKIHNKLEIQNTMQIYSNNDSLIVQAKEGYIYIIDQEFIIKNKFHLNIFSFCKLYIEDQLIYSINSNQLEARNFETEEIKYYNYQTEVFCSSIKVLQNVEEYIILAMDNGIIDVLKNDQKYQSYNLVTDKQNPIFVYDVSGQFEGENLIIIAATNQQKIFVLKDKQQIINLTFSPTSVLFYNKLNPLIALNKDSVALVNNKEICKFNFTNITNYFYEKYFYLCTNEQIVIIDFNLLKK